MNPALAARLIAQQTAGANQQAAGQSGLMRAEQQLAAQNALANVYGQQGNLATYNNPKATTHPDTVMKMAQSLRDMDKDKLM